MGRSYRTKAQKRRKERRQFSRQARKSWRAKLQLPKKECAVYEATQAYTKVAATLKETVKEQKAGDKTSLKLEKNKAGFESLKATITEKKETQVSSKDCAAMEEDLKSYGLDNSLVESLHYTLKKAPTERSEFDATIM